MADKSPGKGPRKPALSIKERRAAKRAKVVESTPMVRKRKRRPDRRFVRRFITNATQMPITGCYRCGRGRFHGASATGREPVRSSGRECANRVECMRPRRQPTASCSSVAYRYTTQHFAGALLDPAGSMCSRYAGDATNRPQVG